MVCSGYNELRVSSFILSDVSSDVNVLLDLLFPYSVWMCLFYYGVGGGSSPARVWIEGSLLFDPGGMFCGLDVDVVLILGISLSVGINRSR